MATDEPRWVKFAADRHVARVPDAGAVRAAGGDLCRSACAKGIGVYFASFTDPHALSAIWLTLLDGGDLRAAEPGVRPGGGVGDRQVSISAARAC